MGAQLAQAAGAKSSHLMRLSHQKGRCVCPARMELHLSSSERGGKFRRLPQGSHRTVGDSQCPGMQAPVWHPQHQGVCSPVPCELWAAGPGRPPALEPGRTLTVM